MTPGTGPLPFAADNRPTKERGDQVERTATTHVDTTQVPGYLAGTWTIDPVHSDVSFAVRHLVVGRVRGRFRGVAGTLVLAANPLDSGVVAQIDLTSIDTGHDQRDADLRSARFFDVARYPTMAYRSSSIRRQGDAFIVEGQLDLHGVTRDVQLQVGLNGFVTDPSGGTRLGLTATAEVDRHHFGIATGSPFHDGAVVARRVAVLLEIEAVLTEPAG